MDKIAIPVEISQDILLVLNESELELKQHFQEIIAISLLKDGKLTFGKAIEVSGLTRFEFEKALQKNKVDLINQDIEQVFSDFEKVN